MSWKLPALKKSLSSCTQQAGSRKVWLEEPVVHVCLQFACAELGSLGPAGDSERHTCWKVDFAAQLLTSKNRRGKEAKGKKRSS